VKGRELGKSLPPAGGKVQIVDVEMDHVEFILALKDLFNLVDMVGNRIPAVGIKSQSLGTDGNEGGIREGIRGSKQCYLVALTHEFIRQPGHNPFRASVETGRNTLVKRRYLCNPHLHLGILLQLARTQDPPSLDVESDTDALLPEHSSNSRSGSFETVGKSLKTRYLGRAFTAIRCSLQG